MKEIFLKQLMEAQFGFSLMKVKHQDTLKIFILLMLTQDGQLEAQEYYGKQLMEDQLGQLRPVELQEICMESTF
mgnify:CR=1 FL=1